jgi:hypothetical protein
MEKEKQGLLRTRLQLAQERSNHRSGTHTPTRTWFPYATELLVCRIFSISGARASNAGSQPVGGVFVCYLSLFIAALLYSIYEALSRFYLVTYLIKFVGNK